MKDFSIRVGSSDNIDNHTVCGRYRGQVEASGDATIECSKKTRYISMKIDHNGYDHHVFTLCEFVAIGYKVIG